MSNLFSLDNLAQLRSATTLVLVLIAAIFAFANLKTDVRVLEAKFEGLKTDHARQHRQLDEKLEKIESKLDRIYERGLDE